MNIPQRLGRLVIACALVLAATATPTIAASSFPTGEYAAGTVTMRLAGDGSVHVRASDTMTVDGSYAVNGDQVRFTDKSGSLACPKGQETGVYHWQQTGDTLVFSKLDDHCDGRLQDLTAQAWKRK